MRAINSVRIVEEPGIRVEVSIPWDAKILGVTWTDNKPNLVFSGSYSSQGKKRAFAILMIGDPVTDEVCLGLHPNGIYSLWEIKS